MLVETARCVPGLVQRYWLGNAYIFKHSNQQFPLSRVKFAYKFGPCVYIPTQGQTKAFFTQPIRAGTLGKILGCLVYLPMNVEQSYCIRRFPSS
jgi:hypothetical protein